MKMKFLKLFENFSDSWNKREELAAAISWMEANWQNKECHIKVETDMPFRNGQSRKVFFALYDSEGFSEENEYWENTTSHPGVTAVLSYAKRFSVEDALEFFSDDPQRGATGMPDQLSISYSQTSQTDEENYDE